VFGHKTGPKIFKNKYDKNYSLIFKNYPGNINRARKLRSKGY